MHTNLAHLQERECARFVCTHSAVCEAFVQHLWRYTNICCVKILSSIIATVCEMIQAQIQWLGHLQLV